MITFLLSILVVSAVAARDPRCVQYKLNSEAMTLPHKTDCRKFHICDIQGNALEMKCPPNTYFSANDGVCSFDSSACNDAVIMPDVKPQPEKEITNQVNSEQSPLEIACKNLPSGTTLPLKGNCISYIVCLQARPIVVSCPEGLAYDSRNRKCEFKEAADCYVNSELNNQMRPYANNNLPSASETLTDNAPPRAENQPFKPETLKPSVPSDADVPQKPIVPIPHVPMVPLPMPQVPMVPLPMPQAPVVPLPDPIEPVIIDTPNYGDNSYEFMPYQQQITHSDPRCLNRIDDNNPILLSHPTDCEKYLVCVGNVAVEKQCPVGHQWSTEHSWCDFPNRAKCKLQ
ncbi:uncharacterized protein LOC128735766 [Sabethes cyaneus]|uniref:uncharacterized protein LOC128735766 n=1 Tax=Sabethes cyaneus TaxID=53552 RepID=UPI00237DE70A|nr:uncharacterized protein LOC128735766 [Sabethes cyaneus]